MSTHSLKKAAMLLLGIAALPAHAQHAGHAMPSQKAESPAQAQDVPLKREKVEATTSHSASNDAMPMIDHAQMDHSQMDHSNANHQAGDSAMPLAAGASPREPLPDISDADRVAAFPPVHDHHRHGTAIHTLTLIDRLEIVRADAGTAQGWGAHGWIGGDVHKFAWRTEGHAAHGRIERARIEALYGVGVRAWWDVVAGVRHDFGEGPERSWIGIGVQGMVPYKFEVSATLYAGPRGRTAIAAEAEYDTLLTNRLILQWRIAADAHGRDDAALGIGAGLSTLEAGMRLRYEINRQFAPYIGIEHARAFGRTADFRRDAGTHASQNRIVAGVRIWF